MILIECPWLEISFHRYLDQNVDFKRKLKTPQHVDQVTSTPPQPHMNTGVCSFTDHNAQPSPRHPVGNAEDLAMPACNSEQCRTMPTCNVEQCRTQARNAEDWALMPSRACNAAAARSWVGHWGRGEQAGAARHMCANPAHPVSYIGKMSRKLEKCREI